MKRKNNLLSLMLGVSLVLHGALFFLAPASYGNNRRPPVRNPPENVFSLVNIALIEPAAPEPPPRRAPPPDVLPEDLPEDPAPAENFIAVTEQVPEDAAPSPPEEAMESDAAEAEEAAALAAAYMKRNFTDVFRRIQDKLLYPAEARRTGVQGAAEISFTLHQDGTISGVTITSSSGSAILDAAAVDAIYAAAPFRRPSAETRLVIPVAFRLR